MSTSTTRTLRSILLGIEPRELGVKCDRRETVSGTFFGYSYHVIKTVRPAPGSAFDLMTMPSLKGKDSCYTYLFSIAANDCSYFKVGVTQNLWKRFSNRTELPPDLTKVFIGCHLFENRALAEKCEMSVLAACADLWSGGEWLREPRSVGTEA